MGGLCRFGRFRHAFGAVLACLAYSCAVVLRVAFVLSRLIAVLRGKMRSLDKLLDCDFFVRLRGDFGIVWSARRGRGGTGAIFLHLIYPYITNPLYTKKINSENRGKKLLCAGAWAREGAVGEKKFGLTSRFWLTMGADCGIMGVLCWGGCG